MGIHIAANTIHHDHAIYPINLRAMSTIVSNPKNPIPLDVLSLLILTYHLQGCKTPMLIPLPFQLCLHAVDSIAPLHSGCFVL